MLIEIRVVIKAVHGSFNFNIIIINIINIIKTFKIFII